LTMCSVCSALSSRATDKRKANMSTRLNIAIRELNIGLQTAVEFLKKRTDLGEVRADLSFKLSDEQHKALVEAFRTDKEARSQAEKLLLKHPKEKKKPEARKEQKAEMPQPAAQTQKYTPLGKIDLDSLGRKSAVPKQPAPQPKQDNHPANQPKQPDKSEQPELQQPHKEQLTQAAQLEKEEQPKPQPPAPKPVQAVPVATAQPTPSRESSKIFTLKSEKKLAPKVNVLGKIDLSSINSSTRPKKKSKEERRKEREEKSRQSATGEKT